MADFFDIVMFKKSKNDKTFSVKLGSAKQRDDGGFWLDFTALPYGEGSVAICPQRPRTEGAQTKRPGGDDMNDSIPF